ncbi:armadillo-type protein [Haematococcus lacustris]
MRHGTEGWRCLESSMRALVAVLEGVTPASHLSPLLTPELRDLVGGCMHHPNRYVREAAHAAAAVMCEVLAAGGQGQGGVAVQAGPGDQPGPAQLSGQLALTRGVGHHDTQPAWAHQQQAQHQQREKLQQQQQQPQEKQQQQQQGQQEEHDGQGVLEEPVVSVGVSQEARGRGVAADPAAGAEPGQGGEEAPLELQQLALHFAPLLADGLTDNWSQAPHCTPHWLPMDMDMSSSTSTDLAPAAWAASVLAAPASSATAPAPAGGAAPSPSPPPPSPPPPSPPHTLQQQWLLGQVRYAAAVAARSVLLCLGSDEAREPLLRHLLPPLCLNRYYPAEGVREFSQASWQIVFRTLGRAAVARHIDAVVPYYIAQSKAVNHGVREAACACMAELAEKVERGAVQPHLPLMQRALLLCFKDMAWPVRDAACTASARCLLAYPEDCRPFLPELLQLWTAHLWDNVQSVRENSARALGDALRAVPGSEPGTPLAAVQSTLSEYLPMSQQQPREPVRGRQLQRFGSPTSELPHYPSGAAGSQETTESVSASVTAGVVEKPQSSSSPRRRALGRPRTSSPSAGRRLSPARAWEQDVKAALAQDQDMFSGGEDWTLFSDAAATRFSAASYIRGDGCMDFGFSREQAPWEACDGAVYMVRELASVLPQAATDWLPQLAEQAAQAEGFDAAPRLRESVWKCLPTIAQHIGKQTLKRYLHAFLRPLFADLSCGCALTEVAAGKAIARMRDLLGAKIFAARLSETQAHELWTNPLIEPAKCK